MKTLKSKLFLSGLIVAVAVFLGLQFYSRADGGVITVCAKKNGVMYLIGEGFKRAECGKNDTLLSWNIQGPPGPKGDKGDPGQNLHLLDANGQDLGLLLAAEVYGESLLAETIWRDRPMTVPNTNPHDPPIQAGLKFYRTHLGSVGAVALIKENHSTQTAELLLPLNGGVFFGNLDCTGDAFVFRRADRISAGPGMLAKTGITSRYFRGTADSGPRVTASLIAERSGSCTNIASSTPDGIRLEEISLPFTEPLAWPLEIRSQ